MVNLALRPLFARPGGHSGCVLPIFSICSRMRSPAQPMMLRSNPVASETALMVDSRLGAACGDRARPATRRSGERVVGGCPNWSPSYRTSS